MLTSVARLQRAESLVNESRKLFIGSRNLGSFCDESRSLVFHDCVSSGLGVSNFSSKILESQICLFSRGSPAKVIALREQSKCC